MPKVEECRELISALNQNFHCNHGHPFSEPISKSSNISLEEIPSLESISSSDITHFHSVLAIFTLRSVHQELTAPFVNQEKRNHCPIVELLVFSIFKWFTKACYHAWTWHFTQSEHRSRPQKCKIVSALGPCSLYLIGRFFFYMGDSIPRSCISCRSHANCLERMSQYQWAKVGESFLWDEDSCLYCV